MKRLMLLALVVGLAATATACGGSKSSKKSSGGKTAVTISNEQGSTWTCGFNPFNSDVNSFSVGPVYEELTFVNGLQSGKTTNWLASSYAWSNGNKTLTFTIRPGVQWSDGKPLTAADVLFTFNLINKFPGLDLNASWSVLKDVKRSGDKITLDFKTAAVPYFYYVADQTPIVPQHIWASIKNPVTYKDAHPIGSGPFKMNSCSPQVTKYTRNPNYWQKGLPKIDTVYYPAFTSNDPANQQLASGLDQKLAHQYDYNPQQAIQTLEAAGYKKKGDLYYTPDGKPLSFTMINIGGYSDWVASAQIVQDDLKKIGIKVTPENLSSTTYDADTYAGKFQLDYNGNLSGGPAPYYELRQELYSKNSAPIGQNASPHWERYYNPAVDKLIEDYAATADSAKQHEIVRGLEQAMVRDVPIIPVTEGVDWYQYNTKDLSGWVTQGNQFAQPAAYVVPDWGVMLLHLKPKGS